jgi:hypothetical protein
MGQQQLLLIVLGVIIVGVAVVVGINLFNANAYNAEVDKLTMEAQTLATNIILYYRKPTSSGGGGRSLQGWNGASLIADNTQITRIKNTKIQIDYEFESNLANYKLTWRKDDQTVALRCKHLVYNGVNGKLRLEVNVSYDLDDRNGNNGQFYIYVTSSF